METKIFTIDETKELRNQVKEAGEILKNGGLVAFPTETVYGLGGNALDADAMPLFLRYRKLPRNWQMPVGRVL